MFVANAAGSPWYDGFGRSEDAAFDLACMCKVLPKFSGVRGRLRDPLLSVIAWAVDPSSPDADAVQERLTEADWTPEQATLPETAAKALRMLRRLDQAGFASFA